MTKQLKGKIKIQIAVTALAMTAAAGANPAAHADLQTLDLSSYQKGANAKSVEILLCEFGSQNKFLVAVQDQEVRLIRKSDFLSVLSYGAHGEKGRNGNRSNVIGDDGGKGGNAGILVVKANDKSLFSRVNITTQPGLGGHPGGGFSWSHSSSQSSSDSYGSLSARKTFFSARIQGETQNHDQSSSRSASVSGTPGTPGHPGREGSIHYLMDAHACEAIISEFHYFLKP